MITVSYSGIGTYNNCPRAFKEKYINKTEVAEPTREDAPAMFRGTDIHNSIEQRLLGNTGTLHKEIKEKDCRYIEMLKASGAKPEVKWSFDRDWLPVDFEDKENGCIRGVLDVLHTNVVEWKTGKMYDEHGDQRSLYGMVGLLLNPEQEIMPVTTHYLDLDKQVTTEYNRAMLTSYKWVWERKINKVQPPQAYPARPNWKCRFCAYSQRKGGPCPN